MVEVPRNFHPVECRTPTGQPNQNLFSDNQNNYLTEKKGDYHIDALETSKKTLKILPEVQEFFSSGHSTHAQEATPVDLKPIVDDFPIYFNSSARLG